MKTLLRRLRGALGNALVWGSVWFGATVAFVVGALLITGGRTQPLGVLLASAVVGAVGAITGGTFSLYLAANFRRSSVDDLSAPRVALGGALMATLVALIIGVTLSVLDGSWPILTLSDVAFPVGLSAALGGITGFSSIKLAQRALPAAAELRELEAGSE
jgi:hypothetical protein